MRDDLKIRELYEQILTEKATANGQVIKENVTIPRKNSSPDMMNFDGVEYDYDENTNCFAFIGEGSDLIGYMQNSSGTHPVIFNTFVDAGAALGLTDFSVGMWHKRDQYKNFKIDNVPKFLKSNGVHYFGDLSEQNIKYFIDKQKTGIGSRTRINTRSGRIWFDVPSDKVGGVADVIVFWCRQKDLKPNDLKALKKNFNLKNFFWCATDSKNFNFYNDDFRDSSSGKIKELKSKIYPDLTHDQIVDILMRAHTGYKITPFEKKVVWEFRGFDPSDVKHVTGGYPSKAEYEANTRLSESNQSY